MATESRAIGHTKALKAKTSRYGWICNKCGNVTLEYRGTRLVTCLNADCDGTSFDPCFVITPEAVR